MSGTTKESLTGLLQKASSPEEEAVNKMLIDLKSRVENAVNDGDRAAVNAVIADLAKLEKRLGKQFMPSTSSQIEKKMFITLQSSLRMIEGWIRSGRGNRPALRAKEMEMVKMWTFRDFYPNGPANKVEAFTIALVEMSEVRGFFRKLVAYIRVYRQSRSLTDEEFMTATNECKKILRATGADL